MWRHAGGHTLQSKKLTVLRGAAVQVSVQVARGTWACVRKAAGFGCFLARRVLSVCTFTHDAPTDLFRR
jgi:hypothetical protein